VRQNAPASRRPETPNFDIRDLWVRSRPLGSPNAHGASFAIPCPSCGRSNQSDDPNLDCAGQRRPAFNDVGQFEVNQCRWKLSKARTDVAVFYVIAGTSTGTSGRSGRRKLLVWFTCVWRPLRSQCRGRGFDSLPLHLNRHLREPTQVAISVCSQVLGKRRTTLQGAYRFSDLVPLRRSSSSAISALTRFTPARATLLASPPFAFTSAKAFSCAS
jgi:hypothetical protein